MSIFRKKRGKRRKKGDIPRQKIDRATFFVYNKAMEKKTKTIWTVCLRVATTLLCVGMLVWIFSNSLKTGEASAKQSDRAVQIVQDVVSVIAPNSPIVTATGEDYVRLHKIVRLLAHFAEFALLGALIVWCWRTYTRKKVWFLLPVVLVCVLPIVDECLQSFTAGRAMEIKDVFIDIAGGIVGGLFALCTLWLAFAILKKSRKRREDHGERELGNSPDQVQ